ncbi:hypothetical protein CYMTET_42838 [Cymbomonas tetramitiformis]|uniref:Cyclic nucleotide-binding domain-containing protein n=1 Tax=Cymbomonas tetramitiformis TaxID=36881 RepID=A0AAE0C522_9CHLO|nr:hypothetical protein CYMTET_42838 [Cymbomonas tetramitiformis]
MHITFANIMGKVVSVVILSPKIVNVALVEGMALPVINVVVATMLDSLPSCFFLVYSLAMMSSVNDRSVHNTHNHLVTRSPGDGAPLTRHQAWELISRDSHPTEAQARGMEADTTDEAAVLPEVESCHVSTAQRPPQDREEVAGNSVAKDCPRTTSQVAEVDRDRQMAGEIFWRSIPRLGVLDGEAWGKLLEEICIEVLPPGGQICEEGEVMQSAFAVLRGNVEESTRDGGACLNELTVGSCFGQGSLWWNGGKGEPTAKGVVTAGREGAVCGKIPGRSFRRQLRDQILRFARPTVPGIGRLPPAEQSKLCTRMGLRMFDAGATIISQGEEARYLYIILIGQVRVSMTFSTDNTSGPEGGAIGTGGTMAAQTVEEAVGGDQDVILRVLGRGACFGERALLGDQLRSATVTADCLTFVVSLSRTVYLASGGLPTSAGDATPGLAAPAASPDSLLHEDALNRTRSDSLTEKWQESLARSDALHEILFSDIKFQGGHIGPHCALGHGSFGFVYLGTWMGAPVAVKMLHEGHM